MIIGFDLDDVLLDFHTSLAVFHNTRYGTNYTRDDVWSWDLNEVWNCSYEEMIHRMLTFYQSEEHWNALPPNGAVDAMLSLSKNHDVHIVTAKPEQMKEKTLVWLEKHFPAVFKHVHFTGDAERKHKSTKDEKCKELGIEVFVEDSPHHARGIAALGIPVLLFNTPWNQVEMPPLVTRVFSWEEIVEKINA